MRRIKESRIQHSPYFARLSEFLRDFMRFHNIFFCYRERIRMRRNTREESKKVKSSAPVGRIETVLWSMTSIWYLIFLDFVRFYETL